MEGEGAESIDMTDKSGSVGESKGHEETPTEPERPLTPPDPQLERYRTGKKKALRFGSQLTRSIIMNHDAASVQAARQKAIEDGTFVEDPLSPSNTSDESLENTSRPRNSREVNERYRCHSPFDESPWSDGRGNEGLPHLDTFYGIYNDVELVPPDQTYQNVRAEPIKFQEQVSARLREPHADFIPGERSLTDEEKAERAKARSEFVIKDEDLGIFIDKDGNKVSKWTEDEKQQRQRDRDGWLSKITLVW